MTLQQAYKRFKNHNECIKHLEEVIWGNCPRCPICKDKRYNPMPKEQRYHCKICRSSYSVTSKTMFHSTKIDLQKWFSAIHLIIIDRISGRELAKRINVTKDTGCFMANRILKAKEERQQFLNNFLN